MATKRKVFLSHNSRDRPTVERVAQELRAMKLVPWLYEENVHPGDSIPGEIDKALAEADYFLLFWSKHALNSRWVRAEYDAAIFRRIDQESVLLVPVLLDGTELPPLLKPISHLDFREGLEKGIARLRKFFGLEGFGPDQPPRRLQVGPSCKQTLAVLRNMDLRLRLKERFSMTDVREVWMDTFNSSVDNDLPGTPLGVAVGEMIIRADQRRLREELLESICANRPDVVKN